ncbi:hypothetical protein AVEN_154446-1 [Araneus ventricosus]|uniref:Uncharacterized protein n=1 Tax=Araneus ventricosus TaxID=182803 RepID=A0A4Y2JY96_ARAVE|nr:hypothetical protein AVEN_154446-1 [Araneus ventricosus]
MGPKKYSVVVVVVLKENSVNSNISSRNSSLTSLLFRKHTSILMTGLRVPNYSAYRTDKARHRGGGTVLLVTNSINHHPTPIASSSFENTTIAIDLPNKSFINVASI